ncbi:MAG: radical SAM protein, partial [Spirochaetaceae bacterium]|nr:radical SAM protein [Spirochaetaceae bacterium]
MNRVSPLTEAYKYAWEPIALKIMSGLIKDQFPGTETEIWHLISGDDRDPFFRAVRTKNPDLVVFSELDLLVSGVNSLAEGIKNINPAIVTVAGGKQSSALRKGDLFPFRHIDAAFRGGPGALLRYMERMPGKADYIAGEIKIDERGRVCDDGAQGERPHLARPFDHVEMRKTAVANQTMESYISEWQSHPSVLEGPIRTSPCYFGEGCPYQCAFCQSPLEFDRKPALLCGPRETAGEIAWLMKNHGVNNFFSLEANMNLNNLREVYRVLEEGFGIPYAAVSGFIRAPDVVKAGKENLLRELVQRGLRVLSVGLDIPADSKTDVYRKSFSYGDMRESLDLCKEYGILVLGTVVGDPGRSREEFAFQLEALKSLPVADIDIRLAMAIRNTAYYRENKKYLLHDPDGPDKGRDYFDRQNYRYQTIQYPGKISPGETY